MKIFAYIIITLLLTNSGFSQVVQTKSSNQNQTSNNSTSKKNSSIFGNELPVYNPGNETVTFNGGTWSVLDNRIFEARFEKYLSTVEATSEQDIAYRKIISDILFSLSPHHPNGPNFAKAIAGLELASVHKIDANLCESISNAIYACELGKKNARQMSKLISLIQKEQKTLAHNAKVSGQGSSLKNPKEEKQTKPTNEASKTGQWSQHGLYIKKMAKNEAKQLQMETEITASRVKNKIEFQSLIIQLFAQRRFEHVIIAIRLYRQIFKDGDSSLHIEKGSDTQKMFSNTLGVNPTLNTLDSFSNEAIRDIDEGIESFRVLHQNGDIASASKRLSEAFMIGEYLAKVRTLPISEKSIVQKFIRKSHHLSSALDYKDYTTAQTLLDEMRTIADDFEYAPPLAVINTAKQVSNLHLNQAKLAAVNGDGITFQEQLKKAAEIWPTNPRLELLSNNITHSGDRISQAKMDFDRLYVQQNYRLIFEDQGRYSGAVADDPERTRKLKEIIKEMLAVEMSIQSAKGLTDDGYYHNAWEILYASAEKFPKDIQISRELQKVTVQVPNFVKAIQKAKNLEEKKEYGSSLAWYLQAKKDHLDSRLAASGIERISKLIKNTL